MPTLGDILGAARSSAGSFQAMIAETDPDLAARLADAAARESMTATSFVRAAVSEFSRFASEEDWATLVSSVRDANDPGAVCLAAMVHWRLTARGCAEHSFRHANHHKGAPDERPAERSHA